MIVQETPGLKEGKTLVCEVANQILKAVWERNMYFTEPGSQFRGKQIFWMQYLGQFFISLIFEKSEDNESDKYTRHSPGLEASLSQQAFLEIWNKWGPFHWDLMAFTLNVKNDPQGRK